LSPSPQPSPTRGGEQIEVLKEIKDKLERNELKKDFEQNQFPSPLVGEG
jgi:hypothetical protein